MAYKTTNKWWKDFKYNNLRLFRTADIINGKRRHFAAQTRCVI